MRTRQPYAISESGIDVMPDYSTNSLVITGLFEKPVTISVPKWRALLGEMEHKARFLHAHDPKKCSVCNPPDYGR